MTRLSCHRFRSNEVRLWLSLIAYNLGNLWRRLVLPKQIENWSLTSLQQRLVKTGGRLVKHARYYWLMLAESSSDAAAVRGDVAEGGGAAGTGGIRAAQGGANLGDALIRRGKCLWNAPENGLSDVTYRRTQLAPLGAAGSRGTKPG